MSERELLAELRAVVRIADEVDVTDWQRGYRACAELVTRWAGQRAQLERLDYRDLLIRYILHVAESEGTTFLSEHRRPAASGEVQFSDEQWAELGKLADELPEPKPLVL